MLAAPWYTILVCPHGRIMQDDWVGAVYQSIAAHIMAQHKLQSTGLANPMKVVIAQRSDEGPMAQRVMSNAGELAADLRSQGFDAQVCAHAQLPLPPCVCRQR